MSTDYEIAIVGAGLASLSAAVAAAGLGRTVAVIEREIVGGHLINIERIDGYPEFPAGVAGYELIPGLQEQASELGVAFLTFDVLRIEKQDDGWRLSGEEESLTAAAVIVATGAALRPLGLPNEESFVGSGVSHCAACDGPLYSGKPVVVVGGGDSALQEALKLVEFADHVTIVERSGALTAQPVYRDGIAGCANIDVRLDSVVTEIHGDGAVNGVTIQSNGGVEQIAVEGVFPFIGLEPATAFLKDTVRCDATGVIVVDESLQTSAPGIFAAGTCRAGASFRATGAADDGAAAAASAHRYLSGMGLTRIG